MEAIRLSYSAFDRLLKVDKLIIVGLKPVAFFGAADADASGGGFGAADSVLAEDQIIVMAANDDADAAFLGAVVEDAVGLEDIAVSAHRLALFAEEHAGLGVGGNEIAAEEIVRVLVADGDAGALVAANLIVLETTVLNAPADVEAVVAVV